MPPTTAYAPNNITRLKLVAPGRPSASNPKRIATTPRATTHPQRDARPNSSLVVVMSHLLPLPLILWPRPRRAMNARPLGGAALRFVHVGVADPDSGDPPWPLRGGAVGRS